MSSPPRRHDDPSSSKSHQRDKSLLGAGHQNDDEVTTSLMGLFAPPPAASMALPATIIEKDTEEEETSPNQSQPSKQATTTDSTAERSNDDKPATKSTAAASSFQNLFELPPSPSLSSKKDVATKQQSTSTPFGTLFEPPPPNHSHMRSESASDEGTPLLSSSSSFGNDTVTPKINSVSRKSSPAHAATESTTFITSMYAQPLRPIDEEQNNNDPKTHNKRAWTLPSIPQCTQACQNATRVIVKESSKPTTWIGAFMCLLYHNVFCLTMGSAITGTYRSVSMLGLFTKMAALGVMTGAPVYWINYKGSSEIPALYPTVDLFTAPFLASIAVLVDEALHNDPNVSKENDDAIFLASFTFLACLAVLLAGGLMVFASVFKLANLGSFLPFPVLAGFFAAVGVLMWTLAFKIDTQMPIGEVLFSGDWSIVQHALLHHVPSFVIAALMKFLGPLNPFYVIGLVLSSIALFYVGMLFTGTSMEMAVEDKWFWSQSDLVYESMNAEIGFLQWAPPAPFGLFNALWLGNVHWGAVASGLEPTLALSFLYLIRCSIHGAAMKKNLSTLRRTEKVLVGEDLEDTSSGRPAGLVRRSSARKMPHSRAFSEVIDLEQVVANPSADATGASETTMQEVSPKPTTLSLKDIMLEYGRCQLINGLVGCFAVVPSVAAAQTFYLLRAEHTAPQVGSVIFLFFFYMTDFKLVGFIPKMAFSSLLLLASLDMMHTWVFKSYARTKEKIEWLVVPIIVVFAFVVGLLNAVFLGIAMSTFIFVATFFRSGVVKYIANGLSVRSTIERPPKAAEWLDLNGELIQILVLQNYLFFGNASSILAYISSMFEDPDPDIDPIFVPPIPRVVILDLTLVTGMDTSSVDVFGEILTLCQTNECKMFLAGVNRDLMKTMSLSGFKPDNAKVRANRKIRFFSDLDNAVGKAEDMLLQKEGFEDQLIHGCFPGKSGFEAALMHIEDQHSLDFVEALKPFSRFTTKITLEPSQILYEDANLDRGLFFIEHGIIKVERDTDATLTRKGNGDTFSKTATNNWGSLNQLKSMEVARAITDMKDQGHKAWDQRSFRVARVGPGWVIGTNEALSKTANPGVNIAVTKCVLHYISYEKLDEVEKTDPVLVLTLYKLLASLMAKRQSITINQLATLHSIMGSQARKHPHGRSSQRDALAAAYGTLS